jgi:hypothetical protein
VVFRSFSARTIYLLWWELGGKRGKWRYFSRKKKAGQIARPFFALRLFLVFQQTPFIAAILSSFTTNGAKFVTSLPKV